MSEKYCLVLYNELSKGVSEWYYYSKQHGFWHCCFKPPHSSMWSPQLQAGTAGCLIMLLLLQTSSLLYVVSSDAGGTAGCLILLLLLQTSSLLCLVSIAASRYSWLLDYVTVASDLHTSLCGVLSRHQILYRRLLDFVTDAVECTVARKPVEEEGNLPTSKKTCRQARKPADEQGNLLTSKETCRRAKKPANNQGNPPTSKETL